LASERRSSERERERERERESLRVKPLKSLLWSFFFELFVASLHEREREKKKICVVKLVLKEEEEREIGLRDSSSRE